jgi:hypothetical protein
MLMSRHQNGKKKKKKNTSDTFFVIVAILEPSTDAVVVSKNKATGIPPPLQYPILVLYRRDYGVQFHEVNFTFIL